LIRSINPYNAPRLDDPTGNARPTVKTDRTADTARGCTERSGTDEPRTGPDEPQDSCEGQQAWR